jgi:hypothetical protein
MPRQINLDTLDTNYVVRGPNVDPLSQAKKIINKNKLSLPVNVRNPDSGIYDMLTTIGVCVHSFNEQDFTFKQTLINEEAVENPKILEAKDFNRFQNDRIPAKDKFFNEDDPFYELDDAREKNEASVDNFYNINKNQLLSDIGEAMASLNTNNNRALKQFGSLE